jgi:hypothetical protein
VLGDVTSPLARTFPAWMSTLTGRHPASTNARFNLMPRAKVEAGDTLADALREAGYSTIYSTDEVRFANIDESYGFERLVTPPIGASDFVLGTANDLPLPNLLSATPLGAGSFRILLPIGRRTSPTDRIGSRSACSIRWTSTSRLSSRFT